MHLYLAIIVLSGVSCISYSSETNQSDAEQVARNLVKKTVATALQAHTDFSEALSSHFTSEELTLLFGGEQFAAEKLISEKKRATALISHVNKYLQTLKTTIGVRRKEQADALEARQKAQREERQKQMRSGLQEPSAPTVDSAVPAPVADLPSAPANKK